MSVHQKTITVPHPEAHTAAEKDLKAAVRADEEIGDGWTVASFVNESGKQTEYVITWADDESEDPPASDPPGKDAGDDGTPESSDPARKAAKKSAAPA